MDSTFEKLPAYRLLQIMRHSQACCISAPNNVSHLAGKMRNAEALSHCSSPFNITIHQQRSLYAGGERQGRQISKLRYRAGTNKRYFHVAIYYIIARLNG